MNTTFESTSLNSDASFTDLTRLGWTPFFQKHHTIKPLASLPARIIGVRKNTFLIKRGDEEFFVTPAGRLYNDEATPYPAVGDWVLVKDSVITEILPRKNALSRKAAGSRSGKREATYSGEQVIAANLDLVFIVCGLDRDYNPRRIERYLTLVYNCGIEPVIVLTKADLHEEPGRFLSEVAAIAPGVFLYSVSLDDSDGLSEIINLLKPDRTAALVGSSGAGKSTLINRLSGEEIRETSEVGARLGKGRHTTTTRDLILLPQGGMVIDNPGIREIGLIGDSESSMGAFSDIDDLSKFCRFKDCSHIHEPGCNVLEAVSRGEIPHERYNSYIKLMNELSYASQRQSKSAAKIERERWKDVSKKAKSIKNRRKQWK